MNKSKGILTHKRWLSVLMALTLVMAVALPAMAVANQGIIRNPNGGNYVNMRQWASYDAPAVATLPVGTSVQIMGTEGAWYSVCVNGCYGYINSAFISFGGWDPNPVPNPVPNPSGQTATVNAGPLNMRESPSMRARVITQLYSGATVSVLSYGDTWTQIQSGSLYGYVLTSYLNFGWSPAPNPNPAPYPTPKPPITTAGANATIRTANGGNLNLRSWASSSATVIDSYGNGTRIRVLTHGPEWCRVQVGDQYGYMVTKYLRFDGGTGGGSSSGGSSSTGGYNAVVNNPGTSQYLNLRAEPNTNSKVMGQYRNGAAIKVLGVGTEWHRVSVDGMVGYMMAKYVKINSTSATPNKTVRNNGSFVNLRAGAGTGYDVLKRVSDGAAATVVIPYGTWSKVIVKNGSGFMSGYMLSSFLK